MSSQIDTLTLGMMTKYWEVGQVKTRLGASIGMPQAASLHRLFVSHLCASLAHVAERNIVCFSPDRSLQAFQRALCCWGLENKWDMLSQGTGTLGTRMARFFNNCLVPSSTSLRVILIGADCPELDARVVRNAARALKTHDVVLGPAADGGYYLIGFRGPWHPSAREPLFRDIPWSTGQVLDITRQRVGSAGLSLAELDVLDDVDTLAQLQHLQETVAHDKDYAQLKIGIEQILTE